MWVPRVHVRNGEGGVSVGLWLETTHEAQETPRLGRSSTDSSSNYVGCVEFMGSSDPMGISCTTRPIDVASDPIDDIPTFRKYLEDGFPAWPAGSWRRVDICISIWDFARHALLLCAHANI